MTWLWACTKYVKYDIKDTKAFIVIGGKSAWLCGLGCQVELLTYLQLLVMLYSELS